MSNAPALTPEEWERWLASKHLRRDRVMTPQEIERHGQRQTGVQYGWPWSGFTITAEVTTAGLNASFDHALAALALHQQSFGFTKEDVEWIRRQSWGDDRMDELQASLANRIEALLPP